MTDEREQFKQFLERHGVPEVARRKLEDAGITTITLLGNRFDDRTEITPWVKAADLGSSADVCIWTLKQAWREADASNDESAHRQANERVDPTRERNSRRRGHSRDPSPQKRERATSTCDVDDEEDQRKVQTVRSSGMRNILISVAMGSALSLVVLASHYKGNRDAMSIAARIPDTAGDTLNSRQDSDAASGIVRAADTPAPTALQHGSAIGAMPPALATGSVENQPQASWLARAAGIQSPAMLEAEPQAKPPAAHHAKGSPQSKPAAAHPAKPAAAPPAKPAVAPHAKPAAAPPAKPAAAPPAKPAATPKAKPATAPQAKPAATPQAKPAAAPQTVITHAQALHSNATSGKEKVLMLSMLGLNASTLAALRAANPHFRDLNHELQMWWNMHPAQLELLFRNAVRGAKESFSDTKVVAIVYGPNAVMGMLQAQMLRDVSSCYVGKRYNWTYSTCHCVPTSRPHGFVGDCVSDNRSAGGLYAGVSGVWTSYMAGYRKLLESRLFSGVTIVRYEDLRTQTRVRGWTRGKALNVSGWPNKVSVIASGVRCNSAKQDGWLGISYNTSTAEKCRDLILQQSTTDCSGLVFHYADNLPTSDRNCGCVRQNDVAACLNGSTSSHRVARIYLTGHQALTALERQFFYTGGDERYKALCKGLNGQLVKIFNYSTSCAGIFTDHSAMLVGIPRSGVGLFEVTVKSHLKFFSFLNDKLQFFRTWKNMFPSRIKYALETRDSRTSAPVIKDIKDIVLVVVMRNPLALMNSWISQPPGEYRQCVQNASARGNAFLNQTCSCTPPGGKWAKQCSKEGPFGVNDTNWANFSGPVDLWNSYGRAYQKLATQGFHRVLFLRYEDLVERPQQVLLAFLQALNLESDVKGEIQPISEPVIHRGSSVNFTRNRSTALKSVRTKAYRAQLGAGRVKAICQLLDRGLLDSLHYNDC